MRLAIVLVMFIVVACSENDEQKTANPLLIGDWAVDYATREHMPTELLNDLYFRFNDDTVSTNFPEPSNYSYSLVKDSLFIEGHVLKVLELISVDSSQLNLAFDYRDNYFILRLGKRL